ncbi:MAG: restriction endonuclease subunit S [Clostridiales bacterium]|nr:restriction endonuclease subunit S [Clostridiales bacterium]
MKIHNTNFWEFAKYHNLRLGDYYSLPILKYSYIPLSEVIDSCESGGRPVGGIRAEYCGQAISLGGEQIGSDGDLDIKKLPYIPFDFFDGQKEGKVRDGDILLCKDGSMTGKVCMVDLSILPHDKVMVNEHVYVLRANGVIEQSILFFLMREKFFQNQVIDLAYRKKGQPGLNSEHLKSLYIPKIPREVQFELLDGIKPAVYEMRHLKDKQVDTVQIIDDVFARAFNYDISEINQLGKGMSYGTQKLEAKAMLTFYNKLADSKSDLLRLSVRSSNPIIRKSDSILSSLGTLKLREIIKNKVHNGEAPCYTKEGFIPAIKTAHLSVDGLQLEFTEFVGEEQYENQEEAHIKCGDVLVCNIGKGSLGKATYNSTDIKAFATSEVMIIRVDEEKYSGKFLAYFLNSMLGVFQFEYAYTGATNQIHIDPASVEDFDIPRIPLEEQLAIVKQIEEKVNLQAEINLRISEIHRKIDEYIGRAIR